MNSQQHIVVVGLGEVGQPLAELIGAFHRVTGIDVEPVGELEGSVDIMHICFPFQIGNFADEVVDYVRRFEPALTVVNSTVPVGTTRGIQGQLDSPVVFSPVRGKHAHMLQDMGYYCKFIGATDPAAALQARYHFESVGLHTKIVNSPEAAELAKLSETTLFGLLIAWAQEVERYCDMTGAAYEDVVSFYDEVPFFPSKRYFPGVIGGHCVLPNIELLSQLDDTHMLQAIRNSNGLKSEREAGSARADGPASSMRRIG